MNRAGPLRASTLKWLNQKSVSTSSQLAFAVDRAQDFLLRKLDHRQVRLLALRIHLLHLFSSAPVGVRSVRRAACLRSRLRFERGHLVSLRDLARAHA